MEKMRNVLVPDDIDFNYYLAQSDTEEKVRPAGDYLDAVMHVIAPAYDAPKNPRMPFANCFVEFRPGEVTLWAGYNGSGKSMLQGQIMALFAEKEPVCIASFEMKPERTIARITRQILQHGNPPREKVREYLDSTDGKLWLYDHRGTIHPEHVVAMAKYCAEKLGCRHIAIDSLMKCVSGEDDYNGQKDFVDAMTRAAHDYNVHIHLVHHLRKEDQNASKRLPGKMDVKGSGAITDLVDNVLILWRNKEKERKAEYGEQVDKSDPDAILICDKQRNGEWEGRTKLYFSRTSMRYSDVQRII